MSTVTDLFDYARLSDADYVDHSNVVEPSKLDA